MATIHDVARACGVAPSTVSRHINGFRVRRAGEIEAAIRELSFRASASAKNLRRGDTRAIAMIVPDIQNPYYAAAVAGAESVGRQNGLRLFLCNTDEDLVLESDVLADVNGRVDGVILVPASESSSTGSFQTANAIPLVLMDRETSDAAKFDTVLIDNHRGGVMAAEHLLALGHCDAAVLSGPLSASQSRGREKGFLETFARAGHPVGRARVDRGDFREDGGYQATLNLMTVKDPPRALFVVNNLMSMGAIRAIRDLGLEMPRDLSLVCFDQSPLYAILSPKITFIDRPMHDQGAMAMRLLLARLRQSESVPAPRKLVMPVNFVAGASTAPPSAERAWRQSAR